MKKIFAILLTCTLALGLAGCGGKAESGSAAAGEEAAVETAENEDKAGEPALTEEETTEEAGPESGEAEVEGAEAGAENGEAEAEDAEAGVESGEAEAEDAEAGVESGEAEAEGAEAGAQSEAAGKGDGSLSQDEPSSGSDVLVIYFSATGTTKDIAEKIANITGGDIYEIKPVQEYTEADLNWHDSDSRTTHEQNDPSFRTEIGSEPVDLAGYTTVYLGYPIWWGEEPRIMDTFVETYSFDGITVIPFCTSASSGIGSSGSNLAANAGTGNWLEGRRFSLGTSEEELAAWIEEME